MTEVLFLGNSHLASLKTGYDLLGAAAGFEARFFGAPAADLAFTQVVDGRIVPAETADIAEDALKLFLPGLRPDLEAHYLKDRRSLSDVQQQFVRTGKSVDIDLSNVSAIFYAAGTSPYDFVVQGEAAAPLPRQLRLLALDYLLGPQSLLGPLVQAIRQARPEARQVLIGTPFRHLALPEVGETGRAIVRYKREQVAALAEGYLFDAVYMPPPELLEDNLLVTRTEYFRDGRGEADLFQGSKPRANDNHHTNGVYGRYVLETFVKAQLA